MKNQEILFHSELFDKLQARLRPFADKVTAAGAAMRKRFPEIPWNTKTLWLVFGERRVRAYLRREIYCREAAVLGLEIEYDLPAINPDDYYYWVPRHASPAALAARPVVRAHVGLDANAIEDLCWSRLDEVFLRTSAVSIGKDGETVVAEDAADRLKDFCTLFAETREQLRFVEAFRRLQDYAKGVFDSHAELVKTLPDDEAKKACASAPMPEQYRFSIHRDGLSLFEIDALPRALITFFKLNMSTKGAPKFYNCAGSLKYELEDVNDMTHGEQQGLGFDADTHNARLYGKSLDGGTILCGRITEERQFYNIWDRRIWE